MEQITVCSCLRAPSKLMNVLISLIILNNVLTITTTEYTKNKRLLRNKLKNPKRPSISKSDRLPALCRRGTPYCSGKSEAVVTCSEEVGERKAPTYTQL